MNQKNYSKEDYHSVIKLYSKQYWLIQKESQLLELINFCADSESKKLVFELLEQFHYLTMESLNMLLNEIAEYIIERSGFNMETTQILSMTYDDQADSSQKIIDLLKMPLFKKGWKDVKTVNIFGRAVKNHKNGKTQLVIVDEFLGSGKTLRSRLKQLKNDITEDFNFKCCFIAGMKSTIEMFLNEGVEIFCPLQLEKGITEYFSKEELFKLENIMLDLELRLAQKINTKDIFDYTFGYGQVEALYTMEGCGGNTPNSVFPVFWWLKEKGEKERNTLLTRFETGF